MGRLIKGFLVFSVSLMAVGAAATELQGFKDVKFGTSPSELCDVKYIKRSICQAKRNDDSAIDAFVARGNSNLGGLTAFGYIVENILIVGTWREGTHSILLDSAGDEDALVTAISESFGNPEYWEELSSDDVPKFSRDSADLTRVFFWEAENGTSIFLRFEEWLVDDSDTGRLVAEALAPEYHDGRKRRELPKLQFYSKRSTKNILRASAKYRARSTQKADADDF